MKVLKKRADTRSLRDQKKAYQEVKQMRRRRKIGKRKSAKMFAKGVMREHPKNRAMTVRGGIRL